MADFPEDETALRETLRSDPSDGEAHAALASSILRRTNLKENMAPNDNVAEALAHLRDAINLGFQTPQTIRSFIETLRMIAVVPKDWNMDGAYLRAFNKGTLGVFEFQSALASLLGGHAQEAKSIANAINMAWREDQKTLTNIMKNGGLRDVLAHPALTTVMSSTVITSLELEALFAFIRHYFLRFAMEPDAIAIHPADRAFCYALANQCFLTEYIYWSDPSEDLLCDLLAETFSADLAKNPLTDPFSAAVVACYRPLSSYAWSEQLEQLYPIDDPSGFGAIVQRHVRDPSVEKKIAASIPAITDISDQISLDVKQQYEENPYPRWIKPMIYPTEPFQNIAHDKYPTADLKHLKNVTQPDILVAGCGTGQQLLKCISGYNAWDVTAIDLSRASLAYAQRQIEKFNIPNIEFLLCDILNVNQLKKTFDIIECEGVLHHMADPARGWGALVDILRPGGIMHIGLYSALASRKVMGAQTYVAAGNYKLKTDGIRRFRRDVIEAMRKPAEKKESQNVAALGYALRTYHDFYTTSMCRDLLFHVQEKNFTLHEIEDIISMLGLRFLGFQYPNDALVNRYAARFPNDPNGASLSNWAIFENENPDTFVGMYNFIVQKPLDYRN